MKSEAWTMLNSEYRARAPARSDRQRSAHGVHHLDRAWHSQTQGANSGTQREVGCSLTRV